jgi:hypothetical protein
LGWHDVGGAPLDREQARQAALVRQQREAVNAAERQTERELADRYRELGRVIDALAAQLARTPDHAPQANALAKLYHDAVARLRGVEQEFEILELARCHKRLVSFREKHPEAA